MDPTLLDLLQYEALAPRPPDPARSSRSQKSDQATAEVHLYGQTLWPGVVEIVPSKFAWTHFPNLSANLRISVRLMCMPT